jgi:hypothetical protein
MCIAESGGIRSEDGIFGGKHLYLEHWPAEPELEVIQPVFVLLRRGSLLDSKTMKRPLLILAFSAVLIFGLIIGYIVGSIRGRDLRT